MVKRKGITGGWAIALAVLAGIVLLFNINSPVALAQTTPTHRADHPMMVYRSPTCGCCGRWLDALESAGFAVEDQVVEDVDAVKQDLGIPDEVSSCHTAVVDGYLVEGHVPVADIQRLLAEKPAVAGIAVPGMPLGSPGMEADDPTEASDPFAVVTFTDDGTVEVFHDYPAGV